MWRTTLKTDLTFVMPGFEFSVGPGARWPPHLLSGPKMLNSEGPTGPQVKEL